MGSKGYQRTRTWRRWLIAHPLYWKNLVSNYFYDLLQRGQAHGLNVSIQDNRVTRFKVFERFIIEENENYYDVKCTIDTLNEHVTKNK